METDRWAEGAESVLMYDVQQLLAKNARGVDRRDWDLMRSTYHEDAIDNHGSFRGTPEELAEYLARGAGQRRVMYHMLGQSTMLTIDRSARRLVVETSCIGYQVMQPGTAVTPLFDVGGEPGVSAMGVRYLDEFTERGRDLRIQERTVVYEWASAGRDTSTPFFDGLLRGEPGPSDFSYRAGGIELP